MSGRRTRRVPEYISDIQTNAYGDPEGYSQTVLKGKEKGWAMRPGRNGRPLTNFCEEEEGGCGRKGGRRMSGAQKNSSKNADARKTGSPRSCRHTFQ